MIESFRAVEWMRAARVRIEAEDAGLGWEEQRRKTLAVLEEDPIWAKLKTRVVARPTGITATR
jgi:hypothetical protein